MNEPFDISKILEIAEQIEENGHRFYLNLAEEADSEEKRNLILSLAQMEENHRKIFASMRENISAHKPAQNTKSLPADIALYLKAIAEGYVFDPAVDPVAKMKEIETMEDIFRMAIELEIDSIVFYVGLKEAMSSSSDREKVQKIIEEEMSHITSLTENLKRMVGG